jgi:hypothetical protein
VLLSLKNFLVECLAGLDKPRSLVLLEVRVGWYGRNPSHSSLRNSERNSGKHRCFNYLEDDPSHSLSLETQAEHCDHGQYLPLVLRIDGYLSNIALLKFQWRQLHS